MDSGNRLAKQRHNHSVSRISARKLHVVGKLVGWNALQNELAGISVFAFVSFERNSKEANSDGSDQAKNDYRQGPPRGRQSFGAVIGLMSHENCYSDGKRTVATRAFQIMLLPA